jgi:MYXO-CTERM domain-containing protein
MVGRINTGVTLQSGNTLGSVGTANAAYGIWCGHIVVVGNGTLSNGGVQGNILWSASMSIKDGVTGATDQRISTFAVVPAPGALALLGIAGFASRRRRA